MTSNVITCINNQTGNEEYPLVTAARSKLVGKICVFTSYSPVQLFNIYIYIYMNRQIDRYIDIETLLNFLTVMSGLMHGFYLKRIREQKCWIKLIQDHRGLVKVFSILASTESLVLTLIGFRFFLVFQWSVNYLFFRHNRKTSK